MARLASQWERFMNTPGASTDDPATYGGLAPSKTKPFAPVTTGPVVPADWLLNKEVLKTEQEKLMATKLAMTDDEREAKELLDAGLEDLADDATQFFDEVAVNEENWTFQLLGPDTLTILKTDGGYGKVPFIGGESFRAFNAYVGKRQNIIFRFKSVEPNAFDCVEMTVNEAVAKMKGFRQFIESVTYQSPDGEERQLSFMTKLAELNKTASTLRERDNVRDKFDAYPTFGTF